MAERMNSISGFLYAQPTFTEGMASMLDFGATLMQYNISRNSDEADALALHADWLAVGKDIRDAIATFAERHPELASNVESK